MPDGPLKNAFATLSLEGGQGERMVHHPLPLPLKGGGNYMYWT